MKKIFCVICVVLIALSSTVFCYAGDDSKTFGASYTALKATPTIDGVFNASEGWGNAMVTINSETLKSVVARYTEDTKTGAGPLHNQSEVLTYMTWDATNLYFATVRNGHTAENHYSNGWAANGIPAWQFCATQLMVIGDWSNITNGTAIYTSQPIDIFTASATTDYGDAAIALYKSMFNPANKRLAASDGFKVAIKNTNSTETCEIAIPWSQLSAANKITAKNGAAFYLGVVVHNPDSSAIRIYGNTQAGNGEGGSFGNKDFFLKVTLSDGSTGTTATTTAPGGSQTTSAKTSGYDIYMFAGAVILSAAAVTVAAKRKKTSSR